MVVKEFLNVLTKYYQVFVIDEHTKMLFPFEDQTEVTEELKQKEVLSLDFYEDSGDGESVLIYVGD